MSTMQEQFEATLVLYRPHAEKMTFDNSEGVPEYWNPVENLAWKMWQAATEAAKATGTAAQDSAPAELPPLPEWVKMDDLAQLVPSEVRIAMRAYGQACADAALADAALSRPVAIPEGYKLVPLEPTPNMCDEVVTEVGGCYSCSAQLPSWGQCTDIYKAMLAAAPASPQPVAKVLTDTQEAAFELAAKTIELFDDKTMENDYMLDSSECAGIIRALKPSAIAALAAASTPTTLTEKK